MIEVVANISIIGKNKSPFLLGESKIGEKAMGEHIDRVESVGKRKMLNFSCDGADRDSTETLSWGVVSSGGDVSFNDRKKMIWYNEIGVDFKGANVNVVLQDTLRKKKYSVSNYKVDSFDYDFDKLVAKVAFKDGLEKLQDATFSGTTVDPTKTGANFLSNVYSFLAEETYRATGIEFVPYQELDQKTREQIDRYCLPILIIKPQSFWSVWQKFGESTQTRIYKQKDGRVVCKYQDGG
jgi:hypothetical protein